MAVLDSTLNQYEVLNYFNYKNGNLYKRFKEDKPMGSLTDEGYVVVGFNKKSQFAHRVIFLMFNGYLPQCIDHIDGNIKNNHPDNLRVFSSNAEHLRETLKGKIPNWTEQGIARMTGRPKNVQ